MAKIKKNSPAEVVDTTVAKPEVIEVLHLDPYAVVVPADDPKKLGRYRIPPDDEIRKLAYSMVRDGQLTPIKVVRVEGSDQLETVYGNTRTLAARMIRSGFEYQEQEVKDAKFLLRAELCTGTATNLFVANLTENAVRSGLSPMDLAYNFQTGIEVHGLKQTKLAQIYNIDKAVVSRSLRLLELPTFVQDYLHDGVIPQSYGFALTTSKLTEEQMREIMPGVEVCEGYTLASFNEAIRQAKKGELPEQPEGPEAHQEPDGEPTEGKKTGTKQRSLKEVVALIKNMCVHIPEGKKVGEPDDNQCTPLSIFAVSLLSYISGDEKYDDDSTWRIWIKVARQIREKFGEQSKDEREQGEKAGSAPMPKKMR